MRLREARGIRLRIVQTGMWRRLRRLGWLEGIRRLTWGRLEDPCGALGAHEGIQVQRLVRLMLLFIVGARRRVETPWIWVIEVGGVAVVVMPVLGLVRLLIMRGRSRTVTRRLTSG